MRVVFLDKRSRVRRLDFQKKIVHVNVCQCVDRPFLLPVFPEVLPFRWPSVHRSEGSGYVSTLRVESKGCLHHVK